MTLAVKMFAAARELAGAAETTVEVPTGATVRELRRALVERVPALGALVERSLLAVNAEYASDDARLSAGDEVALIPPVSGG